MDMFASSNLQKLKQPMKPFSTVGNFKEHSLLSVMKAEEMLSHVKIKNFLSQIEKNVFLSHEQFKSTYIALVKNFAEYTQAIPSIEGGELGSLFAEGLHRALFAIQALSKSEEEYDPLFQYAVFTSALLVDLRKLLVNHRVFISNEKGEFISEWSPFKGSIISLGAEFYKIRFYQRPIEQISPYVSLLLAQKMMPEAGFLWITSDLRILNLWLAALSGDEEGSGGLAHYLKLAKERLEQMKKANFILPIEVTTPEQTEMGENFWSWFKNILSEGDANFANSGIYNVEGFIFFDANKLFQAFDNANWRNAMEQFLLLGIAQSVQNFNPKQPERLFIYIKQDEITPAIEKGLNEIVTSGKSFFNKQAGAQRQGFEKTQHQLQDSNVHQAHIAVSTKWSANISKEYKINENALKYAKEMKEKSKLHSLDTYLEKVAEKTAKEQIIHFPSTFT